MYVVNDNDKRKRYQVSITTYETKETASYGDFKYVKSIKFKIPNENYRSETILPNFKKGRKHPQNK